MRENSFTYTPVRDNTINKPSGNVNRNESFREKFLKDLQSESKVSILSKQKINEKLKKPTQNLNTKIDFKKKYQNYLLEGGKYLNSKISR